MTDVIRIVEQGVDAIRIVEQVAEKVVIVSPANSIPGNAADTASVIHTAILKTNPVDSDELGLVDTEDNDALKKLSLSDVKSVLKSYFDTVYTLSNLGGLAKSSNLSDLNNTLYARLNLGIDKLNFINNQDYQVSTNERVLAYSTLTASRTITLPLANEVNAGYEYIISDLTGNCSPTKTITIACSGNNTIAGVSTEVIKAPYGTRRVISDGMSSWVIDKGVLRTSNNLSDLTNVSAALTALGLGTAATHAATDFALSTQAPHSLVTTYTQTGYWTKQSWTKLVIGFLVGGGGSGGSGRRGAAGSARSGGGGGSGGGMTWFIAPASYFTTEWYAEVGAGGVSRAGITVDNTSGVAGQNGGDSFL